MLKFKKLSVLLVVLLVAMLFVIGGCSDKAADQPADKSQEVSDTSWTAIEEKGELVVGMCAQYPPFESINEETNEPEGFDVDFAKAIGKNLGVEVKIVDAQWEALLAGVEKGDYDVLVTCMSKQEAASANINFSDVYYDLNEIIVVKKDNETIKTVDDFKDKIVGVQSGTGAEIAVDSLQGLKEIKRYNYNPEAFIDLTNDRVDAVVVGFAYAVTQTKDQPDLKIINTPVGETAEIVMVSKKGGDALTAKLNEALAAIKGNGEYDQIHDKWLKL
ncbi:MAG: ABC transporter substrate-binding protein [Syntrophomonadaceae bacterium]|nr:ABC transporter substrate-binding protein [Syntrophomonadaceae bacterium]